MSGTNANILLGFRPTPNIGPDFGQSIATSQQLLQFRQQQQAVEQQNALLDVFKNPDAVDKTTGFPTQDTMQKVTAINPQVGLQMRQNFLQQQDAQLKRQYYQSQMAADNADRISEALAPVYEHYQENVTKIGPEQATAKAAEEYRIAIETLGNNGFDPVLLKKAPQGWDPVRVGLLVEQSKSFRQHQADLRSEKRMEGTNTQLLADKDGRPFVFRPNAPEGKQNLYQDGTPVPDEKMMDVHKVGTEARPTAAGKTREEIEAVATKAFIDKYGHPPKMDDPTEKAAYSQMVLDESHRNEQQSSAAKTEGRGGPSAPVQILEMDRIIAGKQWRDAHGGKPPDLADPDQKAEFNQLVEAQAAKRAGDVSAAKANAVPSAKTDADIIGDYNATPEGDRTPNQKKAYDAAVAREKARDEQKKNQTKAGEEGRQEGGGGSASTQDYNATKAIAEKNWRDSHDGKPPNMSDPTEKADFEASVQKLVDQRKTAVAAATSGARAKPLDIVTEDGKPGTAVYHDGSFWDAQDGHKITGQVRLGSAERADKTLADRERTLAEKAALKAAVLEDIEADPNWAKKSDGEKGVEAVRRMRGAGTGGSLADDPDALKWAADYFRKMGQMPFGIGGTADREAVMKQLAKEDKASGATAGQTVEQIATTKADIHSLSRITQQRDSIAGYEKGADREFTLAQSLIPKTPEPLNMQLLTNWVRTGEKQFGNVPNAQFYVALVSALDEYAKVLSGGTGSAAASTDSARAQALSIIPPGSTTAQIKGDIDIVKKGMALKKTGYDDQITEIRGRIGKGPLPPDAVPVITDDEAGRKAYAKIPEGEPFIHDGKLWSQGAPGQGPTYLGPAPKQPQEKPVERVAPLTPPPDAQGAKQAATQPASAPSTPLPLTKEMKESDLQNGKVYQTAKGPATWDAEKKRFFPVEGK
jgi:hypothetical protein